MDAFSKPGFGWSSPSNGSKVEIVTGGKVIDLENFANGATFINTKLEISIDPKDFERKVQDAMINHFGDAFSLIEGELWSKGTSNHRELKYDLMKIQPNTAFKLHAHPNIEVIFVIRGSLHEYSLQGELPKTAYAVDETEGPSLVNIDISTSRFVHKVYSSKEASNVAKSSSSSTSVHTDITDNASHCLDGKNGDIIINETGSIDLSFTTSEDAELFVIWSGSHSNFSLDHWPPPGVIPSLSNQVIPCDAV